jgi:hypothetical protein
MSKHISSITRYSALALVAILAFAASSALAQTSPAATPAAPAETSTVQAAPATTGPISHTFTLSKINGTLNILVNPDGKWNFSGSSSRKFSGKDFDVTLALKNGSGAVILFEWSGDASNGIQFSKQGTNPILKDNFASFASGHHMAWDYRFTETAAGRAQLYAERQAKKEKLEKEKEEAIKAHDEKLEKVKDAALKQEEQEELSADFGTAVTNLKVTAGQEKSYDEWRAEILKQHMPLKCPNNLPATRCNCLLAADINILGYKTDAEAEQFEKLPPALQKETGTKAYALRLKSNQELDEQARLRQQQQQQSSGGGGTSVGSVMGDIGKGILDVLSFL